VLIPIKAIPVCFFALLFMGMGVMSLAPFSGGMRLTFTDYIGMVVLDIAGIAFIWFIIQKNRAKSPFLKLSNSAWFLSLGIGFVVGGLLAFYG